VTIAIPNIALRYIQRRVLLVSLLPLGLLFALTVTLSRTYHLREEGLAREWFARGNADLLGGQPGKAFEDFRNALFYDPDNNLAQLRLAEALLADGQLIPARSYFLNLWDHSPGSGEVNLDLAHISARMEDPQQAIRYFRSAIYGSWDKDPAQERRNVRLELCEFLLAHRLTEDAKTEIAGLAADTPADDAIPHEENGQLFMQVGEPDRALVEFEGALRSSPRQSKWLEDAGKAAYAAGDYAKAETYFSRAVREDPSNQVIGTLGTLREVLRDDPFLPGLSDEERAQRSWRALQQGLGHLQTCMGTNVAGQPGTQASSAWQVLNKDAQDLKGRVNLQSLRGSSELRDDAMQLVFRIEETSAPACGTPTTADQALMLIAQKHSGSNP
jgi:tetratricopeptide (TPR) repeat protein